MVTRQEALWCALEGASSSAVLGVWGEGRGGGGVLQRRWEVLQGDGREMGERGKVGRLGVDDNIDTIQWDISSQDTLGTRKNVLFERGVLISGAKMHTNVVFGDSNSVLFIKVSLFQGVLLRGVPLYTLHL